MSDSREQFSAIVVLCGPRTRVLSAQDSCKGGAREPGSEDQPGIHPATHQKPGGKRDGQERNSAPDYGRPNLISFETMDSQGLRYQDDG